MSYMRFPIYVWPSSECHSTCPPDCDRPDHEMLHLWPCRGADSDITGVLADPDDYDRDGGIHIRMDLFDELVVCRLSEMIEEGTLEDAVRRVANPDSPLNGNFGSWAARRLLGDDPAEEFVEAMKKARNIPLDGEKKRV